MFPKKLLVYVLIFTAISACCLLEEKGDVRESTVRATSSTLLNTTGAIPENEGYMRARKEMVESQLEGRDIYDKRVLDAMASIPRHEFVPFSYRYMSYEDHPLPIGYGQTISQPYIIALMTQSLQLDDSVRVLEVGTGSGYQAAVLSELCNETYSVEIITELASRANKTLEELGYAVDVKNADGYFGWEEHAPYDAIIVTCAANHIPPPLVKQLKEGGRLVIPLGSIRYHQTLTLVKKTGDGVETEYITGVRFVPMTGEAMKRNT